jgi:hypothetical protein
VVDLRWHRGPDGQPVVLSRPQFLVSEVDVIAQLDGEDGPVTVKEVLSAQKETALEEGQTIKVVNLVSPDGKGPVNWTGPGLYILPLRLQPQPQPDHTYQVVPIPPSPGYRGQSDLDPVRIYPATAETRAQYRQIQKPDN